jgi:hypothetical protein
MLARDNVLAGDDPAEVTFEREGVYTDRATGKPVAATTRYTYQDGEDRYVVSFTRTHDLSASRMIDTIKGVKRIAAKLATSTAPPCGSSVTSRTPGIAVVSWPRPIRTTRSGN